MGNTASAEEAIGAALKEDEENMEAQTATTRPSEDKQTQIQFIEDGVSTRSKEENKMLAHVRFYDPTTRDKQYDRKGQK